MHTEMNEQFFNSTIETISKESNKILNDLKNSSDHKSYKQLEKYSNLLRSIETNLIKLKTLKLMQK